MRISDVRSGVCSSDLPVHFELGHQRAPQLMPWRRRKSSAASLPIDWTKLSYCHGSSMVAAAGAAETGGAPDADLRGSAMISPSLVVAPDAPPPRMAFKLGRPSCGAIEFQYF